MRRGRAAFDSHPSVSHISILDEMSSLCLYGVALHMAGDSSQSGCHSRHRRSEKKGEQRLVYYCWLLAVIVASLLEPNPDDGMGDPLYRRGLDALPPPHSVDSLVFHWEGHVPKRILRRICNYPGEMFSLLIGCARYLILRDKQRTLEKYLQGVSTVETSVECENGQAFPA